MNKLPSTGRLVIAGWLLRNGRDPAVADSGVRVVDGAIADVGTARELRERYPDDPVDDLGDRIVAPGFVNAHTHSYGTLTHGMTMGSAGDDFGAFLQQIWWPDVEDRLDVDMLTAAAAYGACRSLKSGVTTTYDIVEAPFAGEGVLDQVAAAAATVGTRSVLSIEASDRAGSAAAEALVAENRRFTAAHRADPLIAGLMCWHTSYSTSPETMRASTEAAAELGVRCHFHCNEGAYEADRTRADHATTTVEYYDKLGVAAAPIVASQCVVMDPVEIDLIRQHGWAVAHMPLSNGIYGAGIAPIVEFADAGVDLALGSDGFTYDFYEVLRAAAVVQRARHANGSLMPATTVFEMATVNGATALGLAGIGSLDVGQAADLQAIDAAYPTPLEAERVVDQVVMWTDANDVTDVMVAGEWRLRDRQLTAADIDEAAARCREAAQRLWDRDRGSR